MTYPITVDEIQSSLILYSIDTKQDNIKYVYYIVLKENLQKLYNKKYMVLFSFSVPIDHAATVEQLETYRKNPVQTMVSINAANANKES